MKKTNPFKAVMLIFCTTLVALAFPSTVEAQRRWDKKTKVTINQTIEIPGVGQQFLQPGKYVFKLLDSLSNRDIVQILSEDETHVFATILSVANYRLKPTDKTVITFRERPVGQPEAIRAWFHPGSLWGQEFVYPKDRAMVLAKVVQEPVLYVPTEIAPEMVKPAPAVAMKQAPIKAITPTGEVREVAEVIEAPPVQAPPVQTASLRPLTLPQTATLVPLWGLMGLLSLGVGFGLYLLSKQTA